MTASPMALARDRYANRANPKARRRWATPGELAHYCEPSTLQTPALDLIDAAAVAVMDGEVDKQQIAAPPQTGKSERISKWTPLWMLVCDPTLRIVILSGDLTLATRWGRWIKAIIEGHPELGLVLRQDSKSAQRWETTQGGSLICKGIQAGTTGIPIDVLILDDVIKTRKQAESSTYRQMAWDYWENDGGKRARKTIVMATRWREDDLSGRLQKNEPGQWTLLTIPAIAESEDDPLGRQIGEEIKSANPKLHTPGYYYREKATTSEYVWASLFQQRPAPAEGGLFKRAHLKKFWHDSRPGCIDLNGTEHDLRDCWRFMTVDLAASTKTSADYTVAAVWAVALTGDLILLDGRRERVDPSGHDDLVTGLRSTHGADTVFIESRMFGTTLVYELGRRGIPVSELKADADKWTRALIAAARSESGLLWLPDPKDKPWVSGWIDELCSFPNATHDDVVDVVAYAARVIAVPATPDTIVYDEDLDDYERVSIGPAI